eukprot:6009171-Prymnesium_polylepis.1
MTRGERVMTRGERVTTRGERVMTPLRGREAEGVARRGVARLAHPQPRTARCAASGRRLASAARRGGTSAAGA